MNTVKKLFCTAVAALVTSLAFSDDSVIDFGDYMYDKNTGRIEIKNDIRALEIGAALTDGTQGTVNYSLKRAMVSAGDIEAREPTVGDLTLGHSGRLGVTQLYNLKEGDSIAFTLSTAGGSVDGTTFTEGGSTVQFGDSGSMRISTTSGKVSGGPLPGLLAILLVGGAGAGALKLRKSRA